jgi:ribosomal protein S18 acetylase RimI-like enzyme
MFEKVETAQQKGRFNRIWETCWKSKGYELEYSDYADQFIMQSVDGEDAGSVEFKPLTNESEINKSFPFNTVASLQGKIVEIDKLAILPQHQGSGILEWILSLIINHSFENNTDYVIALMEPHILVALKALYKLPFTRLGKRFEYKGDDVVPVAIDAKMVIENIDNYVWFKSLSLQTI